MTEAGLATRSEVANVVPSIDESQTASNYVGSLSVPAILAEPSDAVEGLDFKTAHVFSVETQADTDQRTLELRFGGEPLHGERFLSLLDTIAPSPLSLRLGRTDRQAEDILGDWRIYERDNPNLGYLVPAHSGLKGWEELGKEYLDLKMALGPTEGFKLLPWMMPGEEDIIKPEEFIQSWGHAEMIGQYNPLISGSDFTQLLTDVYGTEEARTRIVAAMRHIDPDKAAKHGLKFKGLRADKLLGLFSDLDIEVRNDLISVSDIQGELRRNGSSWSRNEETERFTELYLKRHCVTFETEDGRLMYAHGISPGFDITQAYADRRRVYFGVDRPLMHGFDRGLPFEYETMEVDTIIGAQTAILPGSVKFQELGLVPAVRWSVGPDGKRQRQGLPEHSPLTSYKQDVLSNVAGLMVLAYLQPQRRRHWRQEARLPGIQATQEMGPAQVPLIAIQQSARLLNNNLMREAEDLATSSL
ncbi:MAG TPA: hypothetical protein VFX86_03190 [Candidatus Saccharimonadales bacterium]|nr:hypothetical protein [Candidatus Saccharimonadales bacterium]